MKLTVGRLRRLVVEALTNDEMDRDQVERKLHAAQHDKQAMAMILSAVDRRFSDPSSKPLFQAFSRAVQAWQNNHGRYDAVTLTLDRLYTSETVRQRSVPAVSGNFSSPASHRNVA